jgi:hypothetical protein
MTTKINNQEHVPMIVTEVRNRPEARNIFDSTTTSMVETTNTNNNIIKQGERANWSNRIVYLLSIIGFVVDLGKE